jgi:periplasmic divalent cation tolerance protein
VSIVLVYSLFGSVEEAERIARATVEERLAACANILGACTSLYIWQDALERSAEVPVLFKTTQAGKARLMARIAALHSYDVPAILAWPATDAHLPFADCVNSVVL